MIKSSQNKSGPSLVKTLRSLQFSLVVLIAIIIVAVIGTVIPQERSNNFYQTQYSTVVNFIISIFRFDKTYRSPLFLGLLVLFCVNLILCSLAKLPIFLRRTFRPDITPDLKTIEHMPIHASLSDKSLEDIKDTFDKAGFPLRQTGKNRLFGEKGRWGYLGAFIVHLSLLILLVGGIISLVTSLRGQITLKEGMATDSVIISSERLIPLGFEIQLDRFDVQFYERFPGRPKSYTSSVTVTLPDGEKRKKDIRVNDPLILNNFTVFQSNYGVNNDSQIISTPDDTARVAVSLKGAPENMPPIVTLDMVMGKEYIVPGFGDSITVQLGELYHNFKRSSSVSGEQNPAVKMDILVNGVQRWSVYAFKNFPGLNMPISDDIIFSFSMIDIRTSSDKIPVMETTYYTVLGVVKDRGASVIWVGSVCMMLGLFLSFYIRPRRLWVVEEEGKMSLGAVVKGNPEEFRHFVKEITKTTSNQTVKGDA